MIRSSRVWRMFWFKVLLPGFLGIYFIWIRKIMGKYYRDHGLHTGSLLGISVLTGILAGWANDK